MSTILKALRRLEDEKQAAADRPLSDRVAARGGADAPRRRGGSMWLAGAGGVAVGAAGAFLADAPFGWLRSEPVPATPVEVGPASGAAPPAPADAPLGAPSRAEPAGVPAATDAPPVAAMPPPAPADASRPAAPPPRAALPPRPAAPAAPKPASAPPAAPEPTPVKVVAPPAPPRLVVTGTEWHPDASRRVARVQLEGRDAALALREGDAVGSLVVREIEPSGVVFRLGEVELRRRVGEAP